MLSFFNTPNLTSAIFVAMMLFLSPVFAVIEDVQFDALQTQQRYQSLISELRCLVCQNQNLADSDADLAKDLRQKIETMLKAGKTDQQIRNYMRERYGDFVLYRTPFSLSTSILWLGPLVLLLIVITMVLLRIKNHQNRQAKTSNIDQQKRKKVHELIDQ